MLMALVPNTLLSAPVLIAFTLASIVAFFVAFIVAFPVVFASLQVPFTPSFPLPFSTSISFAITVMLAVWIAPGGPVTLFMIAFRATFLFGSDTCSCTSVPRRLLGAGPTGTSKTKETGKTGFVADCRGAWTLHLLWLCSNLGEYRGI